MHVTLERQNLLVLANLIELSVNTTMKVLGNDTSKTMAGVKLTRQMVADAATAHLNAHISVHLGSK